MNIETKLTAIRALIKDPTSWQPWRCAAAQSDIDALVAAFTAMQEAVKCADAVLACEAPKGSAKQCNLYKKYVLAKSAAGLSPL